MVTFRTKTCDIPLDAWFDISWALGEFHGFICHVVPGRMGSSPLLRRLLITGDVAMTRPFLVLSARAAITGEIKSDDSLILIFWPFIFI